MERLSRFSLPLDEAFLSEAFTAGRIDPDRAAPFRALLGRITAAADGAPVRVYVCAHDDDARARDLFAWALARTLIQHVPSTLLVDCNFLRVGLSGVVPHADALGFLDLLLYGSSLGVITQETAGAVRVVGAGSFPVTRRMPFVREAFADAARRLSHHARCVVYTGPLGGDDGETHPIAGESTIVIRVVSGVDQGSFDPVDSRIASDLDGEVYVVHLEGSAGSDAGVVPETKIEEFPAPPPGDASPAEAAPPVGGGAAARIHEQAVPGGGAAPGTPPTAGSEDDAAAAGQPEDAVPEQAVGGPAGADSGDGSATGPPTAADEAMAAFDEAGEPGFSSMLPRVFTAVVTVLVVVFIAWWIWKQNSTRVADGVVGGDPRASSQSGPVGGTRAGNETSRDVANPGGSAGTDTAGALRGLGPDASRDARNHAGNPPVTDGARDTVRTPSNENVTAAKPGDVRTKAAGAAEALVGGESGATPKVDGDAYGGRIVGLREIESDYAGQYVVHVSSFRDSSKARADEVYLLRREATAFIARVDLGSKGIWFRVYVGPWPDRASAGEAKKNLDELSRVKFTRIARIPR